MRIMLRSFQSLILLSALSLGLQSCGESGPPKVAEIALALDENGSPGDTVAGLKPENTQFHAIVDLDKSGGGVTVKMNLTAVQTTEGNNVPVVSESKVLEGINNQVDFTITLPRPWPTGTYRVDAFVNDSLSMSREFQIKE